MKNQKIFKLLSLCLLLVIPLFTNAQLQYKTSWIGNTFSGANNKWVQNFTSDIDVAPDGTVVTNSPWDENGRCNGIYKDGDVVDHLLGEQFTMGGCWCWGTAGKTIAIDKDYLYLNNCEGDIAYYDCHNNYKFIRMKAIGFEAEGMFVKGSKLYLANTTGVQIRNKSDMSLISSFNTTGATDIAVDKNNKIWLLINPNVVCFNESGVQSGEVIPLENPTAINIDNNGRLMICESGWKRQVLFYDVSSNPILEESFGQEGGISAGTPGIVESNKFFDMVGAGTDSLGNIYVAMSYRENIIRKFTPGGELVWEVQTLNFLDNVDPAILSDGNLVYGADEIYEMDYSKPAGQQWKLKAITRDKVKYPNDVREPNQSTTSSFIREVDGHRIMYITGQLSEGFYIYYFNTSTNGEIAIPSSKTVGNDSWAKWPDKYGNVWWYDNGQKQIIKTNLVGFETSGNPIFGSETNFSLPDEFITVQKIIYFPDEDVMYLAGFTKKLPDPGGAWGLAGTEIICYTNWSKSPHLKYRTELPFNTWNNGASTDMIMPKSMAITGDYIFVAYVWTDGTSGKNPPVRIYNNKTGEYVGTMRPGNEVATTGWIDIAFGVNAYERGNGEYLVFLEDGSRAKNIMYRWCPTGDCIDSDISTTIDSPKPHSYFLPTDSLIITASAQSTKTTISKMHFYANDSLIGVDTTAPFECEWSNRPSGLYSLKAIAEGSNGAKMRTLTGTPVTLDNGIPEISLLSPISNTFYSVLDTIPFKVSVNDNDIIDSVSYFINDSLWVTLQKDPFDTVLFTPSEGSYRIKAVAFDNDSNSAETPTITINVNSFREPENPLYTRQGIIYRYFEGSWNNLPNFNSTLPKDIGIETNFNITNRAIDDNFAFQFSGFINIEKQGTYTFYTSSDDGSKLYIGNTEIVNNDGAHGTQERSGSILLKPGKHAISVGFFEAGGGEVLDVRYSGPNIEKKKIPSDVLFYEVSNENTAPQITITKPSSQETLLEGEKITLAVQVTDKENNLMKVNFYEENQIIGVGFNSNAQIKWTLPAKDSLTFTAEAIDFNLASTLSEPVSINVDTKPVVSIITPLNQEEFQLGDEIAIEADAVDDGVIDSVLFYINNQLQGAITQTPYLIVMRATKVGTYQLRARAFDNVGQFYDSAGITIKVHNSTVNSIKKDKSGKLYPNPVKRWIHLPSNASKITIYDTDGKRILESQATQIDVSFLIKGIYVLSYLENQKFIKTKFVKN